MKYCKVSFRYESKNHEMPPNNIFINCNNYLGIRYDNN